MGCASVPKPTDARGTQVFAGNADKYALRVAFRTLSPTEKESLSRAGGPAASHRVTVAVTDTARNVSVSDAEVWFHIIYPSGKNLMPQLIARGELFEQDIELSERGTYTFMVHIIREDETPEATFTYSLE